MLFLNSIKEQMNTPKIKHKITYLVISVVIIYSALFVLLLTGALYSESMPHPQKTWLFLTFFILFQVTTQILVHKSFNLFDSIRVSELCLQEQDDKKVKLS